MKSTDVVSAVGSNEEDAGIPSIGGEDESSLGVGLAPSNHEEAAMETEKVSEDSPKPSSEVAEEASSSNNNNHQPSHNTERNTTKMKWQHNDQQLDVNQIIEEDLSSPLIINIMDELATLPEETANPHQEPTTTTHHHPNNHHDLVINQKPHEETIEKNFSILNPVLSPSSSLDQSMNSPTTITDNSPTTLEDETTTESPSDQSSPTITTSSTTPTTNTDDSPISSQPIPSTSSPTITIISSNNTTIQSSSPSSSTYEAIDRMANQRNQRKSDRRAQKNKSAPPRVEPIQSELLENDWLLAGYAEKQGRRSTMEDALVCELTFRQHEHVQYENKYESFIGIYDGHGGSNTSKYVSDHLHVLFREKLNQYEQFLEMKKILEDEEGQRDSYEQYYGLLNSQEQERIQLALQEGRSENDLFSEQAIQSAIKRANSLVRHLNDHLKFKEREQKTDEQSVDLINVHTLSKREVIPLLIRETFLEVNEAVCRENSRDGSTASVVYIPYVDEKVCYIGNVGDSRVVLCRQGEAVRCTVDHRPAEIDERRRVRDAGGTIYGNRVNACLAVTRAIGDKSLHPYVISDASTLVLDLMYDRDEFLVIACDGLWDYVPDEDVVNAIRFENDPVQCSIKLRELAYDRGSTDNISVIVVRFKPNVLAEHMQ